MKRLLALFILIATPAYADLDVPTEFTEEDGSPSVFQPHKVKFSNASVTNNGDGTVSINLSASPDEWQTTSNVIHPLVSSDNVTIGSPTNLGKLGIDGDTDEPQLVIQNNSTQTSKALVIELSDGTDMFTISGDGTITASGTGTPSMTLGSGSVASYPIRFDLSGTDTSLVATSGEVSADGVLAVGNNRTGSGTLKIYEDFDNGTNFASFTVGSLAANTAYTLPTDDGDAGEQLQTDGSGGLTWESAGSGAYKVNKEFLVQSAKLSNDAAVRIDAGTPGSNLYSIWNLRFNDGTNNTSSNIAMWSGRMDDNYTGAALTAKINNFMLSSDSTTTANGEIKYCVSIWAVTSGDATSMISESYDSENCKTQGAPTVMSRDETISIPLTTVDSITAGDWFAVKLRRDGSDTITGDSCVKAFSITE